MVRGGGDFRGGAASGAAGGGAVASPDAAPTFSPAEPSRGAGSGQGSGSSARGRSRANERSPPRRREHAHSREHTPRSPPATPSRGVGGGQRPSAAAAAPRAAAPARGRASPVRREGESRRNNNNDRIREPLIRPQERQRREYYTDDDDNDDDCCETCCSIIGKVVLWILSVISCCWFCSWLCRSRGEISDEGDRAVPMPDTGRSVPRPRTRSSRGLSWPFGMSTYAATALATLLWTIAWIMVFSWKGSGSAATILDFSLTAGETRHVESPNYVQSFLNSFTITADPSVSRGAEVYQTDSKLCPPLTGPAQVLQDQETIPVGYGRFEYDYFFLNSGSSIALNVQLDYGLGNVYLLRGLDILKSIRGETNDDPNFDNWDAFLRENSIIFKQLDKYTRRASISYRVGLNPYIDDDVYILLYDNVHKDDTQFNVQPRITATSHDLSPYAPVCDERTTASAYGCDWRRGARGRRSVTALSTSCVVVRAVATANTDYHDVVTVHISVTRRWGLFLAILSVPFILMVTVVLVFQVLSCCYACCSRGTEDHEEAALRDPLLSANLPPATAPGYIPAASAPAEVFAEAHAVLLDVETDTATEPVAPPSGKS